MLCSKVAITHSVKLQKGRSSSNKERMLTPRIVEKMRRQNSATQIDMGPNQNNDCNDEQCVPIYLVLLFLWAE